jgi:hypothetical protein
MDNTNNDFSQSNKKTENLFLLEQQLQDVSLIIVTRSARENQGLCNDHKLLKSETKNRYLEDEFNKLHDQLDEFKELKCEKESIDRQLSMTRAVLATLQNKNEELEKKLSASQSQIENYKVCHNFFFILLREVQKSSVLTIQHRVVFRAMESGGL